MGKSRRGVPKTLIARVSYLMRFRIVSTELSSLRRFFTRAATLLTFSSAGVSRRTLSASARQRAHSGARSSVCALFLVWLPFWRFSEFFKPQRKCGCVAIKGTRNCDCVASRIC